MSWLRSTAGVNKIHRLNYCHIYAIILILLLCPLLKNTSFFFSFNRLIKRLEKTDLKLKKIDILKFIYREDFFQNIKIPEYAFLINNGKRIIFTKKRKRRKCTIIIGIDRFGNYFLVDCCSKNSTHNKNTKNLEREIETELKNKWVFKTNDKKYC